ncbi:unnamed protein product [Ceutorhynchus assimilis]|uniref:Peroxidase n=1 Tax=Ceutorhynchus assimilis TaxID=467358 RepID=A0A9N9QE86_9CUCU|nr:unnamed protein product [Ceutorhynchus assimilis]
MVFRSVKLAIPLLGVLLWVLSIHSGIFSDAASQYMQLSFEGDGVHHNNVLDDPMPDKPVADILDQITRHDLNRTVAFAASMVELMERLENNLLWSEIKVADGSPSHGMLISFGPEREALERGKDALIALKATSQLLYTYCTRLSTASSHPLKDRDCAKLLSRFTFKGTDLYNSCDMMKSTCHRHQLASPYRSINGSCNSIENGLRGESFTGYSRLLYADYSDGVHATRRSVTKKSLPNARKVVRTLVKTDSKPSKRFTLAVMQWSQFLEHDLSRSATAVAIHTDSPIECCSKDGDKLSPRYVHPFCSPIPVYDDKKYAKEGVTCLNYVRSIPAIRSDCTFGASDQVNQATHYLDGSQIYGSTERKSDQLRAFNDGKLATSTYENRQYLPLAADPTHNCQLFSKNSTCFESGDARVNFQPQLALMHTLWYREHNRIATDLGKLNPDWNDEQIFQETRRIVIAEMAKITYYEWLPAVLGKSVHKKVISSSFYNKHADASVSNAFATAVMRSVKSMSDGMPKLFDEARTVNESIFMRNYFHNPGLLRQAGVLDALARGLSTQASQSLDIYFADDLINKLYTNGKFGFDVLSFDVQRGRDHGLPGYVDYRQFCGHKKAESFVDFIDIMRQQDIVALQHVYASPKDVDLIIGGLLEKPRGDSLFGPTFSCILATQMTRTRQGDRYFYDNLKQPKPFTKEQLGEIEKVSLARIICDNSDGVERMQRKAFEKLSTSNPLYDCASEEIPRLNLNFWQQAPSNPPRYYN